MYIDNITAALLRYEREYYFAFGKSSFSSASASLSLSPAAWKYAWFGNEEKDNFQMDLFLK